MIGVSAIERDITERKQAEDHLKMLLSELNHRVTNALTTVLSISARTLRHTDTLEDFQRAFEGRIRALATAHEMLSASSWSSARLDEIVQEQTAPYRNADHMLSVSGERVFLNSNAALLLARVFHELATNATKYGAFSSSAGRVKVSWERHPQTAALTVAWIERARNTTVLLEI